LTYGTTIVDIMWTSCGHHVNIMWTLSGGRYQVEGAWAFQGFSKEPQLVAEASQSS